MPKGVYERRFSSPRKGVKLSENARNKISASKKGTVPWNKGLSIEDERVRKSVEKGKQTQKGKRYSIATEFKKGQVSPNKGKKMSLEQRKKISMAFTEEDEFSGFRTTEKKRVRSSVEYKNWRKQVFERDDYTCQHCSKKGHVLNAHHIKHFSKFKDKRLEVENGITLCKKCHINIHRRCKNVK